MYQELYKFVEDSVEWRFTSADVRVFDSGAAEWYEPLPIKRTAIDQKTNLAKANLELTVPLDSVIGARWVKGILQRSVSLTVFSKEDAVVTAIWKGRLLQPKADDTRVTLRFESIYTSLQRPGIRRLYMRSCPYILYGRGCRLDKGNFSSLAIVTGVAGEVVTVPLASAQADGYYTGGVIELISGEQRSIRTHVGQTLTLTRELEKLSQAFGELGGQLAFIIPGCDRSIGTCDSKFSNIENFGGFPDIPTKSNKLGF